MNNDRLGSYVQDRVWSSEPEADGKSRGLARRSQASLCFLLIVSKYSSSQYWEMDLRISAVLFD